MFEELGYYREYYIDRKFKGSIKCQKDRELIGYFGRETSITTDKITLDNGKIIKKDVEVMTMIYPQNGKSI